MRPRVTAIVVAHNAATQLERTIAGLGAQTVRPNATVMVHIKSRDETLAVMRAAEPDLLVTVDADSSFGDAVTAAIEEYELAETLVEATEGDPPNDWYWLLGADNVAEPEALAALLDTAERNPSLEVTGPKLINPDDPSQLVEYGRSVTRTGTAVELHQDALDQGQFESLSDVLAVAPEGMLVRRETWHRLGGFDSGLSAVDESLDFSVRTWLSDGRVLLTPDARVESLGLDAPGTSQWGRRTRSLQRYRLTRTAELHRQLSWSNSFEFVVRWLLMLPAVVGRAVMHLLRKQPGRILPDLRAALTVMFGRTRAARARRQFAATRKQPLSALDRLRISRPEWRKMQAGLRDEQRALLQQGRDRYNFITGGGGWVLLIALIASVILLFPLIGTGVIAGGALLPLSSSIGELWANTGYGLRDTGGGIGVADPFQFLLAVLGTLTFWQPSLIITIIWFLALPIATVGAWFAVARFTRRAWVRAFAALVWGLSPTLFVALADGRLGAVLVHILLPWLVVAGFMASRSWAAAAAASLLGVAIAACSPMLLPALLVIWVLALIRSGRGWVRQIFLPVPAAAMFLPLIITQINRGRPFAVLADPSLPVAVTPTRGWHTVFGLPDERLGGWPEFLRTLGLGSVDVWLVLAILLLPLVVLAIVGLLSSGWRLALAGFVMFALGAVTAGVAGGIAVAAVGGVAVPLYVAPAQSLALFGLLVAAVAGAANIGPLRAPLTALALIAAVLVIVPIAPAQYNGLAQVAASDGRTLPALVDAQGRAATKLGTLVVTPLDGHTMQVRLERGSGQKLDQISTLASTNPGATERSAQLAQLAVGFLSSGSTNPTAMLHELGIGFVLVQPASAGGAALEQRMVTALSTNQAVQTVSDISGFGSLFQVVNAAEQPTDPNIATQLSVTNWQDAFGRLMLLVQTALLGFVLLLALPTGGLASRARAASMVETERWENLDRGNRRRRVKYGVDQESVDVYSDAATGEVTGQETSEVAR
ncbi:hypothetical protein EG850_06990 [Gulosibacter macacae]|uniref:Glycosyltransferase family 2 protein n=1 Tax=Gulosibacter macacae TaxID=2488791 RepID=A0A3P3VZ86_9MICO|nr:glycosyltransferase [Gulosibacter macacae]RRJ86759.1 hypothetical protein EG850_06990 [Gulosibacter macacae]